MRSVGVLSLNRVKTVNFFKENGALILLTSIFVFGILFGTIVYAKEDAVSSFAKSEFEKFLSIRKERSFFLIFFSSFLKLLLFFGAVFVSGTSVVGTVISPCVLLWYGFNFGILATYLYSVYSLKGIAFNAIILIPVGTIFSLNLIFACKSAINFSLILTKNFTPQGTNGSVFENFKIYCGKFLYYFLLTLLAAFTDSLVSAFFIKFFNF